METGLERIRDFLEKHKVLNIGYVESGVPQVCAVWFSSKVGENISLHFVSAPTSRHGGEFMNRADVAFTINKDDQMWDSIQGIQGRGVVKPSDEPFTKFTSRYPFAEALLSDDFKLFVLEVSWIRIIDNTVKFGHKEEFYLERDPQ